MSSVHILFESGQVARVSVTLYKAPANRARLLDAYITTECQGAVTRSARRAAEAILNWLPDHHRPREPVVAGIDLAGLPTNHSVSGESGGLAFAIALAAAITGKDVGCLAATGILADSRADSTLEPVGGMGRKALGALNELTSQSQLFLTRQNSQDIDPDLINALYLKQVQVHIVDTLSEVLNTLFSDIQGPSITKTSPKKKRRSGLWLGIALLASVQAFFMLPREEPAASTSATEAPSPTTPSVTAPGTPVTDEIFILDRVTLHLSGSEAKELAPILGEKLLKQLPTGRFIAQLNVSQQNPAQGITSIDAELGEATYLVEGEIPVPVHVDPVNMAGAINSDPFRALIAEQLVANLTRQLVPEQTEQKESRQGSEPQKGPPRPSPGKGFD